MIKNIIITGGFGFIGLNLVNTLLANTNYRIMIIDNFSVGNINDYNKKLQNQPLIEVNDEQIWVDRVSYCVCEITEKEKISRLFKGGDCVIHLAANTGVQPSLKNPYTDFMFNAYGTFVCLDAARENGIKRFIFASSGAPLGEQKPPLHEQMVPRPISPYGASKLSGEGYCSAYSQSFGIETVCLRFSNVYGPGSAKKESLIAKLIKQLLSDEEINIFGDGEQTRDFIFVQDLVDAICATLVCNLQNTHELLQIATGHETSVNTVLSQMLRLAETHKIKRPKIKYLPPQVGDVARNYSDISYAKELLNWQPKVQLEKGLAETVKYFLKGAKR